jgi:hypothetical protein
MVNESLFQVERLVAKSGRATRKPNWIRSGTRFLHYLTRGRAAGVVGLKPRDPSLINFEHVSFLCPNVSKNLA